jgi:hypothetical protein
LIMDLFLIMGLSLLLIMHLSWSWTSPLAYVSVPLIMDLSSWWIYLYS